MDKMAIFFIQFPFLAGKYKHLDSEFNSSRHNMFEVKIPYQLKLLKQKRVKNFLSMVI